MMLPSPRRFAFLLLAFTGALSAAGCGLGDYEDRIEATRKRIKVFDEENKALGDIIDYPGKKVDDKDVPLWPFEVYLRLPKGVAGSATSGKEYPSGNLSLFKYAGSAGNNVLVAAGNLVEKNKEGKYGPGDFTAVDFRWALLLGLKKFYQDEYRFFLDIPPSLKFTPDKRQPIGPSGDPLPTMAFDAAAITDEANKDVKENSVFLVYHYQHPSGRQAGVIYQFPKRLLQDEATLKALDYSLKSLDVGNAAKKRADFKKSR